MCRKQLLGPTMRSESYPFSKSLLRPLDRHCWTSKTIAPAAATTGVCEYCTPWCLSTLWENQHEYLQLWSQDSSVKAFKFYQTCSTGILGMTHLNTRWQPYQLYCFVVYACCPSYKGAIFATLALASHKTKTYTVQFIAAWAKPVLNSWVEQASQNSLY